MIGIKRYKFKVNKLRIEYYNSYFPAEKTSEDEARVRAKREKYRRAWRRKTCNWFNIVAAMKWHVIAIVYFI